MCDGQPKIRRKTCLKCFRIARIQRRLETSILRMLLESKFLAFRPYHTVDSSMSSPYQTLIGHLWWNSSISFFLTLSVSLRSLSIVSEDHNCFAAAASAEVSQVRSKQSLLGPEDFELRQPGRYDPKYFANERNKKLAPNCLRIMISVVVVLNQLRWKKTQNFTASLFVYLG